MMQKADRSQTSGSQSPHKKTAVQNIRETMESIVVAFTLAFIFRAFIVEAFIIPTGSMAVTLYGAHVTHTCSTCGFEYARTSEDVAIRSGYQIHDMTIRCPNCASTTDQIEAKSLRNPSSGDRILVHKWPFNTGGLLSPNRWDTTVFKDPHNGIIAFIKRMVGKPGEVLEIIDGDIFTAPVEVLEKEAPEVLAALDQLRQDLYAHAHGGTSLTLEQVAARYAAINEQLLPYLQIQRKALDAPHAQQALWHTVYNHDFLPNYLHQRTTPDDQVGWSSWLFTVQAGIPLMQPNGEITAIFKQAFTKGGHPLPEQVQIEQLDRQPRWIIRTDRSSYLIILEDEMWNVYDAAAQAAWNTAERVLSFQSDSNETHNIRFKGKLIDDSYAYNYKSYNNPSQREYYPVGDLRLRFVWFPDSGSGGLTLRMNRDEDLFVARIGIDGNVEITHQSPHILRKERSIGQKKLPPLPPSQAVKIEFINLDFRVSLKINDQEVVAGDYEPRLADMLRKSRNPQDLRRYSQVSIGANNMACRLSHVVLERDVYYRSTHFEEKETSNAPSPGEQFPVPPVRRRNPYHKWPGWGTEGWPILLRNTPEVKEYFMLGDNSPSSKDSRLWWEIGPHLTRYGPNYQVGTVREDQLIGRSFFVYWPSGYRRPWSGNIGIIPNFGRMRWIR